MLSTLRIKNLALVDDLTLELHPGLNVISGETGAGKSILIGALNLALGERADRTLIRSGSETCTVEAVFDIGSLGLSVAKVLEEEGLEPCDEHQLFIRRVFSASGSNKQFINGSPTNLASLKRIGELLVDIHGPHDHQSLLHANRQLAILDAYGHLEEDRRCLAERISQRTDLESEKAGLIVDEKSYEQQLDLLRHQVQEIAAAKLQPDEEEELEAEHSRVSNAARLMELSQFVIAALGDSDHALIDQGSLIGRELNELNRIDESTANLLELHTTAIENWRELQSELQRYVDRMDTDPQRLAEVEERLDLIRALKRKYGGSIAAVVQFGEEAQSSLHALESRDAELARINARLQSLDADLLAAAKSLTAARKKIAPRLGRAVTEQLQALGFAQSHFEVPLTRSAAITTTGQDDCEFQFAPNVGEPPRPLRAIASSGEMARVMLALKTVLAVQDEVPVLVFDEVDANVGGETAAVVGQKMREIGEHRQVLCVTHLPAVAAAANHHFVVRKMIKGDRTISEIECLDQKSRVTELGRMLGGSSEAALKHARALLK